MTGLHDKPKTAVTGCVTDSVDENNIEVEAEAIGMEMAAVLYASVVVGLHESFVSSGIGEFVRAVRHAMIHEELPALDTSLIVVQKLVFGV